MRAPGAIAALAAAIAIGAAWLVSVAHGAAASATPVPVSTDYRQRNAAVAFYEAQVRIDPDDQITRRVLAGEYLQRFRENGDFNDVTRAIEMARRSLRLQPYRNVGALNVLASGDLALHRFNSALAEERAAAAAAPFDDDARAQIASILMELGRYEQAGRILASPRDRDPNPTWMSIRARYDELTGNLAGARVQMAQATALIDASVTVPAYTRSWYHLRDAQLAFEAGDGRRGSLAVRAIAARLSRQRDGAALSSEVLSRARRLAARARIRQAQRRTLSVAAGARLRGRRAARPRRYGRGADAPMR